MVVMKRTVGRGVRAVVLVTGVIQQKLRKMIKVGCNAIHSETAMKIGNVLTSVIRKSTQNKRSFRRHTKPYFSSQF